MTTVSVVNQNALFQAASAVWLLVNNAVKFDNPTQIASPGDWYGLSF
ncbi:hypothetical protein [Glaciihabitans sp. UYNi722]